MRNIVPVPGANLPAAYVTNLQALWIGNTDLIVSAGACLDSTGTFDIVVPEDLELDFTVVGPNGLDTGAIAADTDYYIYVLYDTSNNREVCSIASELGPDTGPIMPGNVYGTYDKFKLIAIWKTNGSAQLIKTYQNGNSHTRTYWLDTAISVLSAGTETSFADIGLEDAIPLGVAADDRPVMVKLLYTYTPALAANSFSIRPTGSSATVVPTVKGQVNAVSVQGELDVLAFMVDGVPTIDYKVTASDSLSLWVQSYTTFI